MALEYIHGRKVLHRDIKSSNIFLTGNNTVKLGDFGISRVLENTWDVAQTCVGTPYYMSPEVCENKPYTYKSDVWSLGWVIYEIWSQEHAFSADNLLGLVYKIVQDKQKPIPDCYSEDLKKIVSVLLMKDSDKRPLVSELLMNPFIKNKMQEFILESGFIGNQKLKVRKMKEKKLEDYSNSSTAHSKISADEEAKTIQKAKSYTEDESYQKLTSTEKMKFRKRKEADAKAQELMAATRGAIDNYSEAKKKRFAEFYGTDANYEEGNAEAGHKTHKPIEKHRSFETPQSNHSRTNKYGNVVISNYVNNPIDEREELDVKKAQNLGITGSSFGDSFAANDRDENEGTFAGNDRWEDTFAGNDRWEDTFTGNDRWEDTFAANDRDNTMGTATKNLDTFKLSESNGSLISGLSLEDSAAHTMNKIQQKSVSYDDRKIVSSGKYDPEEYYYNYEAYQSDEFEIDDESDTSGSVVEAEKDPNELTCIVDNYKHYLQNENPVHLSDKDEKFQKEQEKLNEQLKQMDDLPIHEIAKIQLENRKLQIKQCLGSETFEKVYNLLYKERNKGTNNKKVYEKLRKLIPKGNKEVFTKCVDLDQIVSMDIFRQTQ